MRSSKRKYVLSFLCYNSQNHLTQGAKGTDRFSNLPRFIQQGCVPGLQESQARLPVVHHFLSSKAWKVVLLRTDKAWSLLPISACQLLFVPLVLTDTDSALLTSFI
jgi:hypothetical protein